MRLSAIILTRNEAQHIADAVKSVAFADEILVVDSGSTDDTAAIAAGLGARVLVHAWPGFAEQRNYAIDAALGDWILFVDADERVPAPLAEEISRALLAPAQDRFAMPRHNSVLGWPVRHGGWYPDLQVRLFRKGSGRYQGLVHERLVPEADCGRLEHALEHFGTADCAGLVRRVDQYSALAARMQRERGRQSSVASALLRSWVAFWRTYLLKGGFLDGRAGVVVAAYTAQATFYKHLRLVPGVS